MPHIPHAFRIPRRALYPIVPALLVGVIGCSQAAKEELPQWAVDLAPQPAQADSLGWQQEHSEPGAEAFISTASGQVDQQQLTSLLYLQWPQSQTAMHDLLGGPQYTDPLKGEEYWVMPNGHTLTLYYGHGKVTGYSLGDSVW